MSIKTIVFDFGNVVAFFRHRKAAEQLAAYGETSADHINKYLFHGELEADYESGSISNDSFIQYVCRTFQLSCTPEEFAVAYSDMFWSNDAVCALLPRLTPHYRLVLLSNTTDLHSRHFLAQFADHVKWFDDVVLSHKIHVRKPDPRIYQHCQKLVGQPPNELVFIDDMLINVDGAKACGWHGIHYQRDTDLAAQLLQLGVTVNSH